MALDADQVGIGPIGVVIELSVGYPDGLPAAARQVAALPGSGLAEPPPPVAMNGAYVTTTLTAEGIRRLLDADRESANPEPGPAGAPRGAIHRMWPNVEIGALITRSIVTTKCQAVHRAFAATGSPGSSSTRVFTASTPHFEKHGNLVGMPHKSRDVVGGGDREQPCARSACCRAHSATAASPPRARTVHGRVPPGRRRRPRARIGRRHPQRQGGPRSGSPTPSRPGAPGRPRPTSGRERPLRRDRRQRRTRRTEAEQRTLGDENTRYGFTAGRLQPAGPTARSPTHTDVKDGPAANVVLQVALAGGP